MAEALSQNEIEALLAAMSAPDAEPAPMAAEEPGMSGMPVLPAMSAQAGARPADGKIFLPLSKRRRIEAGKALGDPRYAHFGSGLISYEAYDFRRPDKLSKENLRSLQLLHETFASHFASSLAGYLRTQVQLDVVSVEQVPYDEYIRSISASLLNILNVQSLAGQMIFEVDFGMLFSMIERVLGGVGAPAKIARDLTDIEKMLADNIVQYALSDLRRAWENIHPLDFEVASMETSSQFVQIVPGNDTVVLVLFELHMGDYTGAMSMCIPYLLIKPILSKLSAQRWYTSASKKPSALYSDELGHRLHTTKVPCVARLGTAALTVTEIVNLQPGQVVPITVPTADDSQKGRIGTVDLMIGGQVKFRGKTGLRGKNLAVQVEEVVSPAPELVSHKELT